MKVIKSAIAKVSDRVPIPTQCRYCQGEVTLVTQEAFYGKSYGRWPYLYLCGSCLARVGLHPNTDIPLGTLADDRLRQQRQVAKTAFLHLRQIGGLTPTQAYTRLANVMGIPKRECHFAWFELKDCAAALAIINHEIDKVSGL